MTIASLPISVVKYCPLSITSSTRPTSCQVWAKIRSRSSSRYTGSLYKRAGMVEARAMFGSKGKTKGIWTCHPEDDTWGSSWKMLFEILREQRIKMHRRPGLLADAVAAIRIDHQLK